MTYASEPLPPADEGRLEPGVGRPVPKRAGLRGPMPVRCEICQWRGRRLTPRSAPCPACGSRVEFA